MKLYRIKFNDGAYLSGSSIQNTKDRYKALMTFERMKRYKEIISPPFEIETVDLDLNETVDLKNMTFSVGDTYGVETVPGLVVHRSKRYVWTVKLRGGSPDFSTVEKHKIEHKGTYDLKTAKGFKFSEVN